MFCGWVVYAECAVGVDASVCVVGFDAAHHDEVRGEADHAYVAYCFIVWHIINEGTKQTDGYGVKKGIGVSTYFHG